MSSVHSMHFRHGLWYCGACAFLTDALRAVARHVVEHQFIVR